MRAVLVALALASLAGGRALAEPLAFARPETAAAVPLVVTVSGLDAGGTWAAEYSGYGKNISPPVAWSGAPAGVRAYAILVEDPDGGPPTPVIHWLGWNIPATESGLPRNVRNVEEPARPKGMRQGRNSHGGVGWTGPHPPVGDAPHHYHVEVMALDRPLKLAGGADREALLRALRGHVLARGEATALYAQRAERPRAGR